MTRDNKIRVRRRLLLLILGLFLAMAGSAFVSSSRGVAAPLNPPPGPDRFAVITVAYTNYFWWLIEWDQSDVICKIEVDDEGMPTPGDIYIDCGEDIYEKWVEQEPCTELDSKLCEGFYVVLIGSEPAQKEISTKLAAPVVQVALENCSPVYTSSTNICETDPILVLTGLEPIPGYTITGIEGLYENQPFNSGAVCRLRLPITDEDGFTIQFWAYSSYGDSSEGDRPARSPDANGTGGKCGRSRPLSAVMLNAGKLTSTLTGSRADDELSVGRWPNAP